MRSKVGWQAIRSGILVFVLASALALGAGACGGKSMKVFEDNPCGDPEADVENIWSKAERERVTGGMMQNGGVGAPRTVNAINEAMERLGNNYTHLRAKACEAAYVTDEINEVEYKSKVACLDRHLQRSRTHLNALEAGETSAAADLALLADEIQMCD